jgi:hypothetical protein
MLFSLLSIGSAPLVLPLTLFFLPAPLAFAL